MRVAVLSLTRDRLDYTKHCFARLAELAGVEYDHYVLDQGSSDGTREWLKHFDGEAILLKQNIGISRGMNRLIEFAHDVGGYDAIVKFDNDCELVQENTLRDVCQVAVDGDCLLSPRILGLRNPPPVRRELRVGDEIIEDVQQIGGIFLAAPSWVYDDFRFSEANPNWGGDDIEICSWFRSLGGTCGYLKRMEAWHYETTDGQEQRYRPYFERKREEMSA